MSGTDPTVWLPAETSHLVRAVGIMSSSKMGRFAIVGGVAVAVRLGQAHRATQDIDAVVDQGQQPSALEVLTELPEARRVPGGLRIADAKVELLEVGTVPEGDELAEISERDALFVLSHGWALDTATPVAVGSTDEVASVVTAPFATVPALLAMKLHAIQDRSGGQQDKRAGDAWDIHQLLTHHNASGLVSRSIDTAPPAVRLAVHQTVRKVLLDGAERTRSWMRGLGGAAASVSPDELRALGKALIGTG